MNLESALVVAIIVSFLDHMRRLLFALRILDANFSIYAHFCGKVSKLMYRWIDGSPYLTLEHRRRWMRREMVLERKKGAYQFKYPPFSPQPA
jgi:hypothetical protein